MQNHNQITGESNWAAILTLLFQEDVRGQAHGWRAHFKGLGSLVIANSLLMSSSVVASSVYESYLCLRIPGEVGRDVDKESPITKIPHLEFKEPLHGITRSILEIVQRTNSLGSIRPIARSDSIDRVELLLCLQSLRTISIDGLGDCSAKMLLHYARICYYAALIHFHRLLRKTRPDTIQDMVDTAIHLE